MPINQISCKGLKSIHTAIGEFDQIYVANEIGGFLLIFIQEFVYGTSIQKSGCDDDSKLTVRGSCEFEQTAFNIIKSIQLSEKSSPDRAVSERFHQILQAIPLFLQYLCAISFESIHWNYLPREMLHEVVYCLFARSCDPSAVRFV